MGKYIAISIDNETESKLVQKILFKLNYTWGNGDQFVYDWDGWNFFYMYLPSQVILRSHDYSEDGVIEKLNFEEFISKMETEHGI